MHKYTLEKEADISIVVDEIYIFLKNFQILPFKFLLEPEEISLFWVYQMIHSAIWSEQSFSYLFRYTYISILWKRNEKASSINPNNRKIFSFPFSIQLVY